MTYKGVARCVYSLDINVLRTAEIVLAEMCNLTSNQPHYQATNLVLFQGDDVVHYGSEKNWQDAKQWIDAVSRERHMSGYIFIDLDKELRYG